MRDPVAGARHARVRGLLDDLRHDGWSVGVEEQLAVQEALLALEARGAPLESSDDLADWIAPLICRSPREQRELRERLRSPGEPRRIPEPDRSRRAPGSPSTKRVDVADRRWRLALAASTLIGVGAGVAAIVVALRPLPAEEPPVVQTAETPARPVTQSVAQPTPRPDPRSGAIPFVPVPVERTRSAWSQPVLWGHDGAVLDARWNPSTEKRWVLTGGADGTARVFDADSGDQISVTGDHDGAVVAIAWHPSLDEVVTADSAGFVRSFDARSGDPIRIYEQRARDDVRSLEWHPSGERLLVAGLRRGVEAFDRSGAVVTRLESEKAEVLRAAWSPDGARILVTFVQRAPAIFEATDASTVTQLRVEGGGRASRAEWGRGGSIVLVDWGESGLAVHDARTGDVVARLAGSSERGRSEAHFGAEGRIVVATRAGYDPLRIYDVATGDVVAERPIWPDTDRAVTNLACDPGGSRVLVCSDEDVAVLGDVQDGVRLRELCALEGDELAFARWSPDGSRIVAGGALGAVYRFDVPSDDRDGAEQRFRDRVTDARWTPDDRLVVARADGSLVSYGADVGDARELLSRGDDFDARRTVRFALSDDGRRVLSWGSDGGAVTFEIASDALVRDVVGHAEPIIDVDWQPGGSAAVATDAGGLSRLHDADRPSKWVSQAPEAPRAARLSPDGARLAVVGDHGFARLVDVLDTESTLDLEGHVGAVRSVAWSPDGRRLATAGDDLAVRLWSASDGDRLRELAGHTQPVRSVEWSPDGASIVSAGDDGVAILFDAEAGTRTTTLRGHDSPVVSAHFSPDGARIVTASEDRTARVWRIDGSLERVLTGHTGPVVDARWSHDGSRIVTVSKDGTAQVFRVGVPQVPVAYLALPLGIAVLLLLTARRLIVRSYVRRGPISDAATPTFLTVPARTDGSVVGRQLRADVANLRRPDEVLTGDIDVERTVERTVAAAGHPTFAFRARPQTPEYVALVDRRAPGDVQAAQARAVLDRLVAEGVHVDRYDFARDPRTVAPDGDGSRAERLDEVAGRTRGRRLLAFADADVLTDARGRGAPWLEQLDAWPDRTVVVPVPRREWRHEERAALARGVRVAALGELSSVAAADDLPPLEDVPPSELGPAYPPLLRELGARWSASSAPPDHEVERLIGQIRAYLGRDTFLWLCACAVYPEIRYGLTLRLGDFVHRWLDPGRSFESDDLARLSRLPWMRQGVMPDWLRRRMIQEIPRPLVRELRATFQRWLVEGEEAADDALEVAVEQRSLIREAFAGMRRASRAKDGPGEAMRDGVLLSFTDDGLGVALRSVVANALRRTGRHGTPETEEIAPRTFLVAVPCTAVVALAIGRLATLVAADAPLIPVSLAAAYALAVGAATARRWSGARAATMAVELVTLLVASLFAYGGLWADDTLAVAGASDRSDSSDLSTALGSGLALSLLLGLVVVHTGWLVGRRRAGARRTLWEVLLESIVLDLFVRRVLADHRPRSAMRSEIESARPPGPVLWTIAFVAPVLWLVVVAWRLRDAPDTLPWQGAKVASGVLLAAAPVIGVLVHMNGKRNGVVPQRQADGRAGVILIVGAIAAYVGVTSLGVSDGVLLGLGQALLFVFGSLFFLGVVIAVVKVARERWLLRRAPATAAQEASPAPASRTAGPPEVEP